MSHKDTYVVEVERSPVIEVVEAKTRQQAQLHAIENVTGGVQPLRTNRVMRGQDTEYVIDQMTAAKCEDCGTVLSDE